MISIINNKMKIIDCFTFYNELDLLFYRLSILNDVVDKFILVEATKTFSGKAKPLYYENNKLMFSQFQHKIVHIIEDELLSKNELKNIQNVGCSGNDYWMNENKQRNSINKGLEVIKNELNDDDYIFISDVDEIPNPDALIKLKNNDKINNIGVLCEYFYYYSLRHMMTQSWFHSKFVTYELFKQLFEYVPQNVRLVPHDILSKSSYHIIENGGWHLSYFGDEKFIKNKLENFAHQEFNTEYFKNERRIKECIENNTDLFNRTDTTIEYIPLEKNNNLPTKHEIYLRKFY